MPSTVGIQWVHKQSVKGWSARAQAKLSVEVWRRFAIYLRLEAGADYVAESGIRLRSLCGSSSSPEWKLNIPILVMEENGFDSTEPKKIHQAERKKCGWR